MTRERPFLTTGEIAQYCAVSHLTVTNWIWPDKLFAWRAPGGHNRIRREELRRFLIEHGVPVPQKVAVEGQQIQVVDEDRALAESMAHTLQQADYQASVACDGYEADVKMAIPQPQSLVLELLIPGLDGFSLCQRVKTPADGKQTKILALIDPTHTANLRKARACGADLCLEKPCHLTTLRAMVINLLGEARNPPSAALGLEPPHSLRVPAELAVSCTPVTEPLTLTIEPTRGKTLNVSRAGVLVALDVPSNHFPVSRASYSQEWPDVASNSRRKPLDACVV